MRRFITLIGAVALVVAACSASTTPTPTPTSLPATGTPVATTAAPVTPAATATLLTLSATVTWDGQTCSYAGPTVIPRDAWLSFSVTNMPTALKGGLKGASLYVVPVADGTTWEMITSDATQSPRPNTEGDAPRWAYGDQAKIMDATITGGTLSVNMTNNLYAIYCVPPETNYLYPAVLLKVLNG